MVFCGKKTIKDYVFSLSDEDFGELAPKRGTALRRRGSGPRRLKSWPPPKGGNRAAIEAKRLSGRMKSSLNGREKKPKKAKKLDGN